MATPMTHRRMISLASLTVPELSPPEMAAVASRCGYSHIALKPIAASPDEHHFPIVDNAALRRRTLEAVRHYGISVLDLEIFRLKPDTHVAEWEKALAVGAEFGAQFALTAGNDPNLERCAERLAQFSELAGSYGIRPQLEFMPWTNVPDIGTAIAVVRSAGANRAGVLIDAFHLNRSGGTIDDIPRSDDLYNYVQLCDIAGPIPARMADILREAREDRLFPGLGDCPLLALLQTLPATIPISLEVPTEGLRRKGVSAEARAAAAINHLNSLLASLPSEAADSAALEVPKFRL